MTAAYVMIALVVGVFVGVTITFIVRGEGRSATGQILDHVQRLSAVFTNAAHRGRAGEIVLENLLEASGMGVHRDFDLQVVLPDGGRPDVILNLPGRGRLVIDAKFPLDDFQRATSAETDGERRKALVAHGKAVASHVAELVKRDYPSHLPDAMDFIVCFVPSEELLAAAYEAHPALFYEAARDHVLLAGPASLLAILWGVVYGCQQETRVRRSREIGESVAELHRRLGTVVRPLQRLGRSMAAGVNTYNYLLDSLEHGVIPELRRFEDLAAIGRGAELPDLTVLEAQVRPVAADRYPVSEDGTEPPLLADDDATTS
jgi:DNA recombination protein RmuC